MNFKLIHKDNVFYADSRQVAELVDKRHSDLCRDIAKYADIVSTNAELRSLDFFIESSYVDKKGETRKCYLLTKKGCDMVANKMTGEKGILFTATYIDKFYEMEHRLKSGTAKHWTNQRPSDLPSWNAMQKSEKQHCGQSWQRVQAVHISRFARPMLPIHLLKKMLFPCQKPRKRHTPLLRLAVSVPLRG